MTVSLEAIYRSGGAALEGYARPAFYRVTAHNGALRADCHDYAEALRYFLRWATPEEEG